MYTTVKSRIEILQQFDNYVRNVIDDEEILMDWLEMGLPDSYDFDELLFIATDEECWFECVKAFSWCCKAAGAI